MKLCKAENCNEQVRCKGYCNKHYLRMRRNGTTKNLLKKYDLDDVCEFCFEKAPGKLVRNLCPACYKREWRKGYPDRDINQAGLGHIDPQGYRRLQINKRQINEHTLIVEKYLGRRLTKDEVVHHKDGDKLNNNIENLELMTRSEHGKLHAEERR